jgi:acetyl esterase/lipase/lysophospholipase L1-like esterase
MKLKLIIAFLLCVLVNSTNAQEVISLYDGNAPGNLSVEDRESFNRPANGRPSVVNVTKPTITVFLPQHPNASRAAVVICPGGGYLRLTIEDGGYDVAKELAQSGIAAIVLKYRTWRDSAYVSYRDLPVQDYQQAMKIIRANASKWNIDVKTIGVMGFSAGGHLASMVSVANNEFKPAFSILAYPVVSFTDSLVSKTLKSRQTLLGNNLTNAEKEFYSPELHVTASTPSAFIVHAQDDSTSLVNNSIQYYRALLKNKVPAEILLYQKGGHGFASYNKAEDHRWLPSAIKWLALNGFYQSAPPTAAIQKLPAFWNDILAFKKQDSIQMPKPNALLLTGSSSFTKWLDVNNYFPQHTIVNRAFGGSTLPDVIRYAYDAILPYKPKQVMIYCGENDLATNDSITPEEVLHRVKTLFAIIRENLPNATISYVSIKPSPVRAHIQARVKETNKLVKRFIKKQKKAQFINVYDAMLNADGTMREELFIEDRLHMNAKGYAIWKKIIEPYLVK